MKKQLPKIKKSLKSFILEEDAKILDKTATKISLLASFASITFLMNADSVNAKGHGSHTNHKNSLTSENFKEDDLGFYSEMTHANHYNHSNGGGGNC